MEDNSIPAAESTPLPEVPAQASSPKRRFSTQQLLELGAIALVLFISISLHSVINAFIIGLITVFALASFSALKLTRPKVKSGVQQSTQTPTNPLHTRNAITPVLAALVGMLATALGVGAFIGMTYVLGSLGYYVVPGGIGLTIAMILPSRYLERHYAKQSAAAIVLLSSAPLITVYMAIQAYGQQSNQSLGRDFLVVPAMGLYYLLATAILPLTGRAKWVIVALGVFGCIVCGPKAMLLGSNLGRQHFQDQTNRSVLGLPYTVYGPSAAKFKLEQAQSEYTVQGSSREVDLVYSVPNGEFEIANIQLPARYDPPSNCVTFSGLASDYQSNTLPCKHATTDPRLSDVYMLEYPTAGLQQFIVKHQGSLLIINSRQAFSVSTMYELVSSLKEVTQQQMLQSPKGISYNAGQSLPGQPNYIVSNGLVPDPTPTPTPTPTPSSSASAAHLKVCSVPIYDPNAIMSTTMVVTGIDAIKNKITARLSGDTPGQPIDLTWVPGGPEPFDKDCKGLMYIELKTGDLVIMAYSPAKKVVYATQKTSN